MGIISIKNLVHRFSKYGDNGEEIGEKTALEQVSLDIEKGSFVAILGHNGSGKSTLAKHLNALLLPTEGTVYISDKLSSDEKNLWKIRQSTGMVFQNPDNQIELMLWRKMLDLAQKIWAYRQRKSGSVSMKV